MVKIIDEGEFENEVLKSEKLILVDFFANWCGPCKTMAPILEEVSEESDNFKVAKIDIDKQRDLALDYEIEFIPTMILFKNGKEIDRLQGVVSKQAILEKIEELG